MNTRICTMLMAVLLCLSVTARGDEPAAGEVFKKRYIWQPGTTTYYRHSSISESSTSADDQEPATKSITTMLVRQEVYSVKDDGTGRVAITLKQVHHEGTDSKGTSRVFDSREPDKSDPDTRKVYGALAGRTFIMEITPDGRMVRMEGVQEMVDAMFGSLDELKEVATQPMMQKMRKSMEETISQASAIGLAAQPQGRRIGEEWTNETNAPAMMFGEMTGKTVYKLESVDTVDGRRIMTTRSTGERKMKPAPEPSPAQKPTPGEFSVPFPRMQGQAVASGIEVFDLNRGRLIRSEDSQDMTGSMTITMPDITGRDRTAMKTETRPLRSKSITVIELVRPEDPLVPEKAK